MLRFVGPFIENTCIKMIKFNYFTLVDNILYILLLQCFGRAYKVSNAIFNFFLNTYSRAIFYFYRKKNVIVELYAKSILVTKTLIKISAFEELN